MDQNPNRSAQIQPHPDPDQLELTEHLALADTWRREHRAQALLASWELDDVTESPGADEREVA